MTHPKTCYDCKYCQPSSKDTGFDCETPQIILFSPKPLAEIRGDNERLAEFYASHCNSYKFQARPELQEETFEIPNIL